MDLKNHKTQSKINLPFGDETYILKAQSIKRQSAKSDLKKNKTINK